MFSELFCLMLLMASAIGLTLEQHTAECHPAGTLDTLSCMVPLQSEVQVSIFSLILSSCKFMPSLLKGRLIEWLFFFTEKARGVEGRGEAQHSTRRCFLSQMGGQAQHALSKEGLSEIPDKIFAVWCIPQWSIKSVAPSEDDKYPTQLATSNVQEPAPDSPASCHLPPDCCQGEPQCSSMGRQWPEDA